MKKVLSILILSLVLIQCSLPPPILTSTLAIDLPSGAGTSAKQNFTDFRSTLTAGSTTLTFTNQDGELLEFKINGLNPGANYDITGLNSLKATMKVTDENGVLTQLNIEDNGTGFLTVTGMSGTGSNITGMAGQFQVNVEIAGSSDEEVISPNSVGTITGNIGFNNQP
jgi:hypothetical protein